MKARDAFAIAQKYDRNIAGLEDEVVARINKVLATSFDRLEKSLKLEWERLERDKPFLPDYRKAYLADQIGYLLELTNPEEGKKITSWFDKLLSNASAQGYAIADTFLNDAAIFAALPVEAIAYSAKESFSRLTRHGADFASEATTIIGESLAQGWGVATAVKQLRLRLDLTKTRAEAIVRTESIKAYSSASQQKYLDAGVGEFIWVAVRQGVCPICTYRNGRAYRIGAVILPAHVSCRCTLIPKVGNLADSNFWAEYRRKVVGEEDSGLSPFEKNAGYSPPTPTWEPRQ
jgi:SPP1 gp7 family putative phage head morphogenesis protein